MRRRCERSDGTLLLGWGGRRGSGRSRRGGRRRSGSGGGGAALLLLEELALLFGLLLQLLLQLLALLLQELGIGRLAVERRAEILERDIERQLPAGGLAGARDPHHDAHHRTLFQGRERARPDLEFGGAGVLEAH